MRDRLELRAERLRGFTDSVWLETQSTKSQIATVLPASCTTNS